ncbi:MAG: hypothetical protein HQL21_02250 [Candidatus Omnitrophica bacterium]|nr:hypothetical protein [Candidatus Omnitrophota bacterium]
MRAGALFQHIDRWSKEGIISSEQVDKIKESVRLESRRRILRFIQILFIMGAFWVVFGLIAVLRLIPFKILSFLLDVVLAVLKPLSQALFSAARVISPQHPGSVLAGFGCFLVAGLFFWLGIRLRKRSQVEILQLGSWHYPELRLGTTSLVISYIAAVAGWGLWNYTLYPAHSYGSHVDQAFIFPVFLILQTIFFLILAYVIHDQIALLFWIGSLAQVVGMMTGYFTGMYSLSVQSPMVQVLTGGMLLFIGLWHEEKARGQEKELLFVFGRTYQWTGLLFVYLALWVMSILGINFSNFEKYHGPQAVELWVANILFLGASLGSLGYGAFRDDKVYFNYGLTFLIIFSYTVFFSHVWSTVGSAWASLLLGGLLIGTGYGLRQLWMKGVLFRKK